MSNLKATKRENLSAGSNNKLRAEGYIPAILYGGKDPNQNISVSKKEISNMINSIFSRLFFTENSMVVFELNGFG